MPLIKYQVLLKSYFSLIKVIIPSPCAYALSQPLYIYIYARIRDLNNPLQETSKERAINYFIILQYRLQKSSTTSRASSLSRSFSRIVITTVYRTYFYQMDF